jgi:hypothetical protein
MDFNLVLLYQDSGMPAMTPVYVAEMMYAQRLYLIDSVHLHDLFFRFKLLGINLAIQ